MNKIELIKRIITEALSFDNGSADYMEGVLTAIMAVCELEAKHGGADT